MLLTTNKKCHCTEVATGDVLWRKVFLKNSQISQENTCVRGSFLIKLQALTEHLRTPRRLRALAALLKNILWHKCFPVNFVKFLRALFYRTPLGDCFCHTLVEYGDLSVNLSPWPPCPQDLNWTLTFKTRCGLLLKALETFNLYPVSGKFLTFCYEEYVIRG